MNYIEMVVRDDVSQDQDTMTAYLRRLVLHDEITVGNSDKKKVVAFSPFVSGGPNGRTSRASLCLSSGRGAGHALLGPATAAELRARRMCRPRRSCRLPEREQLASTLRCLHRPLGSTQAECNIEIFKGTDRVESQRSQRSWLAS